MEANFLAVAVLVEVHFALTGILCLGDGLLGRGMIRLAWLIHFSGFNSHDAIIVTGLFGLASRGLIQCPLCDGEGKDLQ